MYSKLRKKFILFSLAIVTAVLVVIVGGINISIDVSNTKQSETIMYSYVIKMEEAKNNSSLSQDELLAFYDEMNKNYGNESYFTAKRASNGVIQYSFNLNTPISEEKAYSFYIRALREVKTTGYIDGFKFLKYNNGLYFLDCNNRIQSQESFLVLSLIFSFVGLIVLFGFSYFGSALIFRNVKVNDSKQKEFISDASHQLKTPLMVISVNNDLLAIKNGETEETRTISKQIEHMNSMVSTLLTISKANEAIKDETSLIPLSNMLNEQIQMFRPILTRANIKVYTEIQEDIHILSNDYRINEIVKIILENASKYAKSSVDIILRKEKKYVELTEINDSTFTEDEDLNYLTDRFVRGSKDPNRKSGSGIGLALLKVLLDNQKSTLDIQAKDGKFVLKIRFKAK